MQTTGCFAPLPVDILNSVPSVIAGLTIALDADMEFYQKWYVLNFVAVLVIRLTLPSAVDATCRDQNIWIVFCSRKRARKQRYAIQERM